MSARLHVASGLSGAESSSRAQLPIRVVLADDHAGVRRSLRLLLKREQDVEVIAEASDLSTVVNHVHGHLPDVLVLDLRFRDGSSLEAIRRLRARLPETEIVVMTMEENPMFAQRAIDAGAVGFVLKDTADSELMAAIRNAARGDEYVSPRVAAGQARSLRAHRRGSPSQKPWHSA